MQIKRKKSVNSFKIVEHNKPVLKWIIGLFILLILVLFLIKSFENNKNLIGGDKDSHGCLIAAGYGWCEEKQKCLRIWEESCGEQCYRDEDCVPSTCCHPNSCVIKASAPNCSDKFCTQECKSGTLDCDQASCGCISGKCGVLFK